jgi:hypothetical protein
MSFNGSYLASFHHFGKPSPPLNEDILALVREWEDKIRTGMTWVPIIELPPEQVWPELRQAGGMTSQQPAQGTELEFVIMVIAVSCVKLLSAHNSTQHTSRKHKV